MSYIFKPWIRVGVSLFSLWNNPHIAVDRTSVISQAQRLLNSWTLRMLWSLILIVAAVSIGTADVTGKAGHEHDQLFRVYLLNHRDLSLQEVLGIPEDEIDIWRSPRDPDYIMDVLIKQDYRDDVISALKQRKIRYDVVIKNIQSLIHEQEEERQKRSDYLLHRNKRSTHGYRMNTSVYNSFYDIYWWMDAMARDPGCGGYCFTFSLGVSYEGRPLRVIQMGNISAEAPVIWIDGGMHAREWISPATVIKLIEMLVTSSDPEMAYLRERFRWYIVPVANPDGYTYTRTTDRMWRKNRSKYNRRCEGVDLNRNWGFMWGGAGSSSNPCAGTYRGSYPFSEPETRALSNFIKIIRHSVVLYMTLHSYGQFWLTPWGYTGGYPEDYEQLKSLAKTATDVLYSKYNTTFRIGTAGSMLYLAAGGSDDWAKGVAKVRYSYTIELKDTGEKGFLLPEHMVKPTTTEFVDALKVMLLELAKRVGRAPPTRGHMYG